MAEPFSFDALGIETAQPGEGFSFDRVLANPRRVRDTNSINEAILNGVQSSATGLAVRGKLPEQQLAADAPWYHRLAANAAGMAADLPLSIAAAVPAAPTGPIGMGAAGFAAPMALRDALMEAYGTGHAVSWSDAWSIAKAGLIGGAKGAVIGGATMGAGKVLGNVLGRTTSAVGPVQPLVQSAAARGLAATGAELATMTTTAAALEGHLPSAQDFVDNAILLGGLKGAVAVAGKMRRNYAETGKTPGEQVADAALHPALKAELLAPDTKLPAMYEPLALEQRIKAAVENDPRPELIRQTLEANRAPDKIGDVAADHIRYEYIADKDSAAGVLRATTELYQAEIAKQTRGEVPNQQTAIEGLKLIAGGKIGEHIVGQAGNAAEIYARAHILRGAANHAVAEMAKIADIPAAELSPTMKLQALAAIERVSMLKAEVEGIGAEAGRSLQILGAIKRDPSFLGEASTLLALAERKGALQDIAALARAFKDPAQMAEFARKYTDATTTEKVLEAWKAAILSGPQTHLANIMGNSAKWMLDIPERTIAATLFAAERAIKGDPLTMAQYKARALSPLFGLQLGAMDSLKVAAAVWKQEGALLEKADVYRTAIQGKKGEVIRIPFRLLQVEDALFRTTAERAEAHIMAVDRAAKEGLDPRTAEYRAKIVEWTQDPAAGMTEKAGQKAVERVQNAGAEAVFSERLGPRMETLQRAMAGHPIQLIVPFVRTPVNLLSWAVQHTPGFLLSGRWREDFAAGGERQARAVSRVIVGTGLAMTAYSMTQDGLLTGGGLFDTEMARTKSAAGWQPYSVLINGKYYSYQRMEPVAKVLGVAADLVELSQSKKLSEEDRAKAAGMLVMMFGNATISTTYMSGMANAMQSVLDPERYGENFMEQYASSLVPKIVGQTVALNDPYKREIDGVIDAIQSQLPYFREQLLPKRDAWGEPQKNERWFGVMPVARTTQSDDMVRTEAVRLQVAISNAPQYAMESGPFNAREKRIKLEPEQRDIIREVSGKVAMEILSPIVNAPDWGQIPDFAKAAIYKDVLKGAREQGVYTALPPDAAERQALREKIVRKIIQQTQEVSGN